MGKNQKELNNLSNQMLELFIQDIFSKNKVTLDEAKSNISNEQRESLRNSVNQLKEQIDSFLNDKDAKKTVTEENQNDEPMSPLRKMFLNRGNKEDEEKD